MSLKQELRTLLNERDKGRTPLSISIILWNLQDRSLAERCLRELMAEDDEDPYLHVFLIQLLCWRNSTKEAEELVHQLLVRDPSMTGDALQARIEAKSGGSLLHSQYVIFPNSSMQNIGFFAHSVLLQDGSKLELLTKLTTTEFIGTELYFNERIAAQLPAMGAITPPVLDVGLSNSSVLCSVTMERIAGDVLRVDLMTDDDVDRFVQLYQVMNVIDPFAVVPELRNHPFEIGLSHAYLVSAFQKFHTEAGFQAINDWLEFHIHKGGYPKVVVDAVANVIQELRRITLFRFIDPEQCYSFLHGDLHRNNVLVNEGQYWIIDWGKIAIGPRAIDLAVLFRRFSYERLQDILSRNNVFPDRSPLEMITFSYALIVVSVMINIDPIKNEPPQHLFLPACRHILEMTPELR